MGGANRLVRAIAANKSRVGREFAGANVGGSLQNDFLGLVQLLGVPRGDLSLIRLKVMANQTNGIPFEDFLCGQSIQAQLQILFRLRVLLRLAGFVVDDLHVVASERIYLVHAADDGDVILERKLEAFLLLQHFWWSFE